MRDLHGGLPRPALRPQSVRRGAAASRLGWLSMGTGACPAGRPGLGFRVRVRVRVRVSVTLSLTPTQPQPAGRPRSRTTARRCRSSRVIAVRAAVDQQGRQLDGLGARRGEQRCTRGGARHARREYDSEAVGGQGVGLGGERRSSSQPSPRRRLDRSLPRIMSRGEGAARRAAIRSA